MFNNKGQMVVLNIMVAMSVIITAIIFIEPLKDVIDIGRTDLNCVAFDTLGTGEAMTCIWLDIIMALFVLTCFGVGLAYISNKNVP